MLTKTRATIDDLLRVPGKAELIDGEIVRLPMMGGTDGGAADALFYALRLYVRATGTGRATTGTAGFRVHNLPRRESFSPDAAFYTGPGGGMKFFPEPPVFAAEVRSEGDYGPQAEREMADKRADYFAAGTLVVWDVDVQSEDIVRVYRASAPDVPTVYRRGDIAEAEPAVPGWTMPGDDLLEQN